MAKKKIAERLLNEYRLTIRNEDDFAERGVYIVTLVKVLILILLVFITFSLTTFFLGRYITTEYYTSGALSEKAEQDELLYELVAKTDTLEEMVRTKEQFIKSFQLYVGDQEVAIPEVVIPDFKISSTSSSSTITEPIRTRLADRSLTDVYFLPPISGYGVSRGFDAKTNHFGADIVAKEGEPILSIADGTVIFSSWTDDTGFVIAVQHEGNITSFYKHNSIILKKVGDLVQAGDAIAIIGNSGKISSGPHLHFEMWYKGEAINPEHYISFEK